MQRTFKEQFHVNHNQNQLIDGISNAKNIVLHGMLAASQETHYRDKQRTHHCFCLIAPE